MARDEDLDDAGSLGLDPVVRQATKRFNRCAEWESDARQNFLQDHRFAHGDAYNNYQWSNQIRSIRELENKPCLTLNICKQHNLQIVNEAKQNKSTIRFRAVGGGASKKSADIYEALKRRIEYLSDAQSAYATAQEYQVNAGWGWVRLVCEYTDNKTFDQDIRIRRMWDPLSVYIDPDCRERDKSDARYGIVFDLVPDDQLYEAYPELEDMRGESPQGTLQPLGNTLQSDSWTVKDHTRVAEYFRKVKKKDQLISFINEQGGRQEILKSRLTPQMAKDLKSTPLAKWRDVEREEIEWFLIVGQEIIDQTIWPGKYIPLVKIFGEESIVDGRFDCKGHTRIMLDAQRMYNYNASAQVEFVALQSKSPILAAAKAIEEFESYYNTANVKNHSVLPWNHIDDEGNPVPEPKRLEGPKESTAYQVGMETALNQIMLSSGQFQAQMGMMGNERTGAAMDRRQEQAFTAVYHFQDNYAMGLKLIAKMILDLVPHIYDTRRLLMLKTEDGEDFELDVDPSSPQAYREHLDKDGEVVARVLNPLLGQHDVEAEVGPAIGTRREETVRALTLLLTQAPALTGLIGDILLRSMDIKEADEAAERIKRMLPPQALGKGPTQKEQALMQQLAKLQGALAKSLEAQGIQRVKLQGKDELRDIEIYDSETKRMAALQKQLPTDQEGLAAMIHQLVQDSLSTHLEPVLEKNDQGLGLEGEGAGTPEEEEPPLPGAQRAPDGEWYINDPSRKSKYLRVTAQTRGKANA